MTLAWSAGPLRCFCREKHQDSNAWIVLGAIVRDVRQQGLEPAFHFWGMLVVISLAIGLFIGTGIRVGYICVALAFPHGGGRWKLSGIDFRPLPRIHWMAPLRVLSLPRRGLEGVEH